MPENASAVALASTRPKPRLGFVGLGWIGYKRMAAILEAGFGEAAAIADPSEESLTRAAELAPQAVRGGTLEDVLALDLDGVVIATPSAQHAAESIAVLQRGLPVFCQKPLGRNLTEVSAVVAAARSADRLLGVDLSYRYTDALQKIRPLIANGDLGEIFAVDVVFHNAYGPQKPWFYDPKLAGGGCVVDLGIHMVDAALWMLGHPPVTGVRSRLSFQGRRLKQRPDVCEDYATAQIDLANGATVSLACSWNLPAGRDAVIEASFYGTKGGAAMRNVNGSFVDFRAERFQGTKCELLAEPPDVWGGRAAVEWARKLMGGSGYDPEAERLLEVTAVLDAIYARCGDGLE